MTAFPGLLNRPYLEARRQALISLAGGLLAAGAPTTDPGAGQRLLGQAFTGALNTYNNAHANAWRYRLLRREEAERRRKEAARERYRKGLTGAFDTGDAEGLISGATRRPLSPGERLLAEVAPERLAFGEWERANAAPAERFKPIYDAAGNIVGQQSTLSGRAYDDPRAPRSKAGRYVNWWNPETNERRAILQGSPAAAALADGGWLRGDRSADATALTLAQQKANTEIDTARARILGLEFGLEPDESLRDALQRRMRRATDTGRENPDYDPDIAATWRKANGRKYGQDPDYAAFHAALDRRVPKLPQPVPAPRPEPDEPGLLDRLLGGASSEAASTRAPGDTLLPGAGSPGAGPEPARPPAASYKATAGRAWDPGLRDPEGDTAARKPTTKGTPIAEMTLIELSDVLADPKLLSDAELAAIRRRLSSLRSKSN